MAGWRHTEAAQWVLPGGSSCTERDQGDPQTRTFKGRGEEESQGLEEELTKTVRTVRPRDGLRRVKSCKMTKRRRAGDMSSVPSMDFEPGSAGPRPQGSSCWPHHAVSDHVDLRMTLFLDTDGLARAAP